MPIENLSEFKSLLENPTKFLPVFQTTTITLQGRMFDLFSANLPTAGSTASTGIPLNSGTAGSINSPQTVNYSLTGNDFTIIGSEVNISTPGYWILCDRLAHSAGANATTITNQTVGLPTASLPRYTNGIGVMMGITVWTAIGSTLTACRATYTNSNDVTGRLTPDIQIAGASYNTVRRFMLLPLQQGD